MASLSRTIASMYQIELYEFIIALHILTVEENRGSPLSVEKDLFWICLCSSSSLLCQSQLLSRWCWILHFSSLKIWIDLHTYDNLFNLSVHEKCYYRVTFLTGPAQKNLSRELVPPNSEKLLSSLEIAISLLKKWKSKLEPVRP